MKISLLFARTLKELLEGKEIGYGAFQGNSKRLIQQFLLDGVLEENYVGRQQKRIHCSDTRNLIDYIHHKFEIPSLDGYISLLEKDSVERSEVVKAASDSKHVKTTVLAGFMVNTYAEILCQLNNKPFLLNPGKGNFTFISDFHNFRIPSDVTVVGVEGCENFKEIERQRYLFDKIHPLFVWRYQNSSAIVNWLKQIPNNYLHFGDFDPAGLKIYLSEFRNKLGKERCNFFVPENLETLFSANASRKRFEEQKKYFKMIDQAGCAEIEKVVRLLKKYKKGLDQEVLIQ